MLRIIIIAVFTAALLLQSSAFTPLSRPTGVVPRIHHPARSLTTPTTTATFRTTLHPKASTSTSLQGLFGLGGPEIAICLVAAGVLLGPAKLGELTKELGKVAGELKDVPVEFQKGLKEGEANAKSIKAKSPPPEIQDAEKVEEKVE